jgi:uncharacterized protein (DUF302 family)
MNATVAKPLGLRIVINDQYQSAYDRVITALRAAGFEIVAEMNLPDFTAKKEKWQSQLNRLIIVCHPELVHRALIMSPEAGVLLTCNVGVLQLLETRVEVTITDSLTTCGAALEPHLKTIADDLFSHLQRVLNALR